MSEIFIQYVKTNIGELLVGSYDNKLCLCDWRYRKNRKGIDQRIQQGLNAQYVEKPTPLTLKVQQQIREYLGGKRTSFDVPLLLVGSDFQKKVWEALLSLPHGKTCSYLSLSKIIDREKAIRAVAAANGANAISLLVPCHRVVGSKGELVGYAGGIVAKKFLLELEARSFQLQLNI